MAEIPEDGIHDGVKTETIRIFTSHEAADVAAANLQAHHIQCWITADDGGGMLPNLAAPGGVRLVVQASDAAAAGGLLADLTPAPKTPVQAETEDAISLPAPAISQKKFAAVWWLLIGIVVGVLLCLLYQRYRSLGERTVYHYNRDGKADTARIYRNGQLVELMKDRNLDGSWDYWVYYEQGQAVSAKSDDNFDGKPDETWTYANGLTVAMERDTDFNGIPDEFCTYKYGVIQQMDIRPNGAKFATQRMLYQNGVLTEILRGGDAAGNFKEAVRYDPFANPISTNKPQ
jgi:hypothetical protein